MAPKITVHGGATNRYVESDPATGRVVVSRVEGSEETSAGNSSSPSETKPSPSSGTLKAGHQSPVPTTESLSGQVPQGNSSAASTGGSGQGTKVQKSASVAKKEVKKSASGSEKA